MGSDVSFNTLSTGRVTQQQMTHGNPLTKYMLMTWSKTITQHIQRKREEIKADVTSGQSNHLIPRNMSSSNSANIPSPTPSSFTVNMDTTKPLPVRLSAETPVVHQQEPLSIPAAVVAVSAEFSEFQLSPQSVCATLEGHRAPGREELLLIAQGLAGVARKNQEVGCDYQKQLKVLKWQSDNLAKCEVHAACLEETYKHWMEDTD